MSLPHVPIGYMDMDKWISLRIVTRQFYFHVLVFVQDNIGPEGGPLGKLWLQLSRNIPLLNIFFSGHMRWCPILGIWAGLARVALGEHWPRVPIPRPAKAKPTWGGKCFNYFVVCSYNSFAELPEKSCQELSFIVPLQVLLEYSIYPFLSLIFFQLCQQAAQTRYITSYGARQRPIAWLW